MIYYNGGVCYILLKEGKYTVKISHVVPTNPQIAEELLLMNIAKAHEEMVRVTDDKEVKEAVLAGLVRNDDTVCMCKEFREMEEGMCHCQLYVKTKDESIQG